MLRRFALGALLLVGLGMVLLVFVFAQEEQLDSTQMKLIQERVRVTVKKRVQYEFLKEMVGECPPFDSTYGEPWEFVINQWQRKQLEKTGAKVRVVSEIKPEEECKQVEYKLVREIDLGKDGVESIVFGPKKEESSALSEIILGLKDEGKGVTKVSLYDFNFNLIGGMHLSNVTFSKNLKYIRGIEYEKVTQYGSEKWMYKFKLFDYTGKKLWGLEEKELHYELDPNGYSISNKGTVIERDHENGVVTFFDQNGNKIKTTKVCTSGSYRPGIGGGIFSDDGEYAMFIANQYCPDSLEKIVRILFFSWDGKELWRFTTEENDRGGDISKFGNYMIVSSITSPPSSYPPDEKSTYLLSNNGDLIKRYENVLGSLICFSSNEKYALFNSPYEGAFLIDLPSGEVLLKYGRLAGFHLAKSLTINIAEDAKIFGFIACHPAIESFIKEKKGNIEVVLIGFDGLKFWSDIFTSPDYRLLSPVNLSLSDDGKQIVIQISRKIMIYEQVE